MVPPSRPMARPSKAPHKAGGVAGKGGGGKLLRTYEQAVLGGHDSSLECEQRPVHGLCAVRVLRARLDRRRCFEQGKLCWFVGGPRGSVTSNSNFDPPNIPGFQSGTIFICLARSCSRRRWGISRVLLGNAGQERGLAPAARDCVTGWGRRRQDWKRPQAAAGAAAAGVKGGGEAEGGDAGGMAKPPAALVRRGLTRVARRRQVRLGQVLGAEAEQRRALLQAHGGQLRLLPRRVRVGRSHTLSRPKPFRPQQIVVKRLIVW